MVSGGLEVTAALGMPAVTIQLDQFSSTFAGCTAVFAIGLRGAGARGILALLWFVVISHSFLQ